MKYRSLSFCLIFFLFSFLNFSCAGSNCPPGFSNPLGLFCVPNSQMAALDFAVWLAWMNYNSSPTYSCGTTSDGWSTSNGYCFYGTNPHEVDFGAQYWESVSDTHDSCGYTIFTEKGTNKQFAVGGSTGGSGTVSLNYCQNPQAYSSLGSCQCIQMPPTYGRGGSSGTAQSRQGTVGLQAQGPTTYHGQEPGSSSVIYSGDSVSMSFNGSLDAKTVLTSGSIGSASNPLQFSRNTKFNDGVTISPDSKWNLGANKTLEVTGKDLNGYSVNKSSKYHVIQPGTSKIPSFTVPCSSSICRENSLSSYSITFSGSGGVPPYHWSVVSQELPPGGTFDSKTGTFSGNASGDTFKSYFLDVTLTDAAGPQVGPETIELLLAKPESPMTITNNSCPNNDCKEDAFNSYTIQFSVSGGVAPYRWMVKSADGKMPPGGNINASTGLFSGSATNNLLDKYYFAVLVVDAEGQVASPVIVTVDTTNPVLACLTLGICK